MCRIDYPELVWTPEMIERFWDWQSQTPEVYFTYQFGEAIAGSLAPYLKGRRRVLDYGCGVGYLVPHLCRHAVEVFAADTSEVSVAEVNRRLAGVSNFRGATSIKTLADEGATFDAIIAVEVIEHLYDDALSAMLADIRERLVPGGIVILTTPNDEDLSPNMILCPESGKVFHRWQHVRKWTAKSLAERLLREGFTPLEMLQTNLADGPPATPIAWLRRQVKRRLRSDLGRPHLVAIAEAADVTT